MNNEFKYYEIQPKFNKAFPLISTHPNSKHTQLYIGDNFSKYRGKPIPDPQATEFVFSAPIPKQPVIGDYFVQPEGVVFQHCETKRTYKHGEE